MYIDIQSGFVEDIKYKRKYELGIFNPSFTELTPMTKIHRRLMKMVNLFLPYDKKNYIIECGMFFDKRLVELNFKRSTFFEGYWQSYLYFKDFAKIIRTDLKEPLQKIIKNHELLPEIVKSNSVAVHFRFFDEDDIDSNANLCNEYYQKAIGVINSNNTRPIYYIFSDNISRAKETLHKILGSTDVHFVDNTYCDPIIDLALMSSCKHIITSNSSFSWWAAWLGDHENKQVLTPYVDITGSVGSWSFDGLIPPDWEIIE